MRERTEEDHLSPVQAATMQMATGVSRLFNPAGARQYLDGRNFEGHIVFGFKALVKASNERKVGELFNSAHNSALFAAKDRGSAEIGYKYLNNGEVFVIMGSSALGKYAAVVHMSGEEIDLRSFLEDGDEQPDLANTITKDEFLNFCQQSVQLADGSFEGMLRYLQNPQDTWVQKMGTAPAWTRRESSSSEEA